MAKKKIDTYKMSKAIEVEKIEVVFDRFEIKGKAVLPQGHKEGFFLIEKEWSRPVMVKSIVVEMEEGRFIQLVVGEGK